MRLAVNGPRRAQGELTIGIVGPHELWERRMFSGPGARGKAGAGGAGAAAEGGPPRRLVAAAYRDEQEAADQVVRLGSAIDVCLFASRVPYEYARAAGVLTGPATYVPLGGGALYAALLRASRETGSDPARASVDVLSRADVEDAFAELGVPSLGVHVREDPGSPAVMASFHERLWRRDETSVAFTCMQSVAQKLSATGVPVFILRPTGSDIRSALRTAALLGGYRRLEDAQLALALVEVPALRDTGRRGSPRQSREEMRLTVHRFLVQEAQRIHAAVSPTSDHGFLIVATRRSLAPAARGAAPGAAAGGGGPAGAAAPARAPEAGRPPPVLPAGRGEAGATTARRTRATRRALSPGRHARPLAPRAPARRLGRGCDVRVPG